MKGTDYILKALAVEGIEALFFVPGGLIDPFLSAFRRHTADQGHYRGSRGRRLLYGRRIFSSEREFWRVHWPLAGLV